MNVRRHARIKAKDGRTVYAVELSDRELSEGALRYYSNTDEHWFVSNEGKFYYGGCGWETPFLFAESVEELNREIERLYADMLKEDYIDEACEEVKKGRFLNCMKKMDPEVVEKIGGLRWLGGMLAMGFDGDYAKACFIAEYKAYHYIKYAEEFEI